MSFASRSCRWRIRKCSTGPENLIRSLIHAVVAHLSADSLGHVKGYVEFDGGWVSASSALIPPEVTVKRTGQYHGDEMWMNVTLIFFGQSREAIGRALALAGEKTGRLLDCIMEEDNGQIRGN